MTPLGRIRRATMILSDAYFEPGQAARMSQAINDIDQAVDELSRAKLVPPKPDVELFDTARDSNAPTVIAFVFMLVALVVLVWVLLGVAQAFHPPNV